MSKTLALVFGVVFLLVGILGVIGGFGIVGPNGIFMTDTIHDIVHLLSGIVFLGVALVAPRCSSMTMIIFGVVYLLVAILGLIGTGSVLGLIIVNGADNILHVILGLVILGAGLKTKGENAMAPVVTPGGTM